MQHPYIKYSGLVRLFSGFNATEIRAVTRIHLDGLTLVDEQRYADFGTGLHLGGLQCVGGGVTLQTGLRPRNLQMHLGGQLGIEHGFGAGVCHDFHVLTFLHELHTRNLIFGDANLLERLVIHKDIVITLLIKVLIGATLHAHILQFFADIETTLQHVAADYVLQSDVHDGVALTRLAVQEVDAEVQLAIHADAGTLLDVL